MAKRLPGLLLAGAQWRERVVAAIGAFAGIALSGLIATFVGGPSLGGIVLLAAPLGASSVLVFAVPASPLAQPWPVLGGNMLPVLVGIAVAQVLGHGALAAGLAVCGGILLMSLCRCLHPPGGATALLPVLGGPAVLAKGPLLALMPVGLNALVLVAVGLAFHRLSGHSYPHRPAPPPLRPRLLSEDIDAALAELGESFDIDRADLEALLERAEAHAETRRRSA